MENNISKYKEGVNFILLRNDGSILMQLRDDGRGKKIPYPNMWAIPGGHVDLNESPIQAVVREVKEEFGIETEPKQHQLITTYNHDNVWLTHVFIYKINNEMVIKKHEGARIKWMTFEEIKKTTLAWEQEKVLSEIEDVLINVFNKK